MIKINISMSLGRDRHSKGLTVKELADGALEEIERKRSAGRFSTASNDRTAVNSFLSFVNDSGLPAQERLSPDVLKGYEQWLLARNVCPNTIGCYFRSLRALYNRILNLKCKGCNGHENLFADFSAKPCRTKKRSVTAEDVRKLQSLCVTGSPSMQLAKDIFLFSFYTMGMPFVDVAYLKKEDVANGVIVYNRHKTGRRICVPLEACITQIISRYQHTDCIFVFPLLSAYGEEARHKEFLGKLRWYNSKLKKISSLAGITPSLTSYVARHTWASLAYSKNIGINVISQALGHASTKMTSVYIKELQPEQLKEANRLVLSLL